MKGKRKCEKIRGADDEKRNYKKEEKHMMRK
jgi:hypothetical protein